MASNYTEHYQLNQWEAGDKVLRTDFNADNLKIDGALHALAGRDAALETMIGACGNCGMEVLTYTGTGTHGSGNPTKISFSQKPDIFLIGGDLALVAGCGGIDAAPLLICKDTTYSGSFVSTANTSWSGTQLSLTGIEPRYQMNTKGVTYWVLGLRAKGG